MAEEQAEFIYEMRLDSKDLAILRELQRNARISNVALADAVSLSPTPCARRVRRLERIGALQGYGAKVSPEALGYKVTAIVKLRLTSERQGEVAIFENAVLHLSQIMECHAVSGSYDYLLKVVAKDLSSYHDFLRTHVLTIKAVEHVETGFILNSPVERNEVPIEQESELE